MIVKRNIDDVTATEPWTYNHGRNMVRPPELLPEDVLPTERLLAGGKPRPELRSELRRIPNVRNAVAVVSTWAQILLVVGGAVWLGHPLAYAAAFVLQGRNFARLAILGHEAAHRLLFSNRTLNDGVGRWVLSYPSFSGFDNYRRAHFTHHRDELGPEEPDLGFYRGYPIPRASLRRKLTRDLLFVSGYKNLKGLVRSWRFPAARPVLVRMAVVHLALFAAGVAVGRWWLYPLLWLAPWMSVWKVFNRLRAIAEHGGCIRSDDRRQTTHHVRQGWWARFWIVPFHTGWHLAHHVDMGVPWTNLPRLHRELVAAGWVVPGYEWPSYTALWRAMARG